MRILSAPIAALLAAALPGTAQAAPVACSTLIAQNIAWMGQQTLHRRIGAKFARVKITPATVDQPRWGHISVAEGAFGWHDTDMTGRFLVAFNERRDAAGRGFDPARRDITDITLYADGRGAIMLRSWGDTRIVLTDMRCDSAGFLSGIEREGNGVSQITLSLRHETY